MGWLTTILTVVPKVVGAISKSVSAWKDGKKKPTPVNELTFKDVTHIQEQIKKATNAHKAKQNP
jgi:hypothetical protein